MFARLLGRSDGLSSLSPDELHVLREFHTRHDRVHEQLLRQAFTQAEPKTIPRILFQLQLILQEGRKRLMYLDHFQFKHQPFCERAAVTALWQDQRAEEGLARLNHLISHGVLGLLTGPSGVGKSALLKRFLNGLSQQCETVYCHLTHLSSSGLLKLVATQLGERPRHGKERLYEQILQRAVRAEGSLLLVFDEAHLLSADSLTDLRLLVSSALEVGPPLKLLLAGQESLRATLKRSQHADLLNRVSVRFHMRALTREQTVRYVDFQLSQAGGDAQIMDDSVKGLIHDFTGGIPRAINSLATACLIHAWGKKLARIDDDVFQHAAGEFQLG